MRKVKIFLLRRWYVMGGAALLAAHAAGDPAPLGQGSNTSMHRVRPRASQAEACRSLYERYRSAYLSGL